MNAEAQQKLVFVGLGNPGKNYVHTRHNLGFLVVEELAKLMGWSWQEDKKFNAKVTKGFINDCMVHLIEPLTYMNLSGLSVRQYLEYYKLTVADLVVICDDIAFPFGQLRLRSQGSAGGHNGLKSIIACLGSEGFIRLRMGIGANETSQSLADYVLSDFSIQETEALAAFVKRGAAVLKSLTTETIAQAMSEVNRN